MKISLILIGVALLTGLFFPMEVATRKKQKPTDTVPEDTFEPKTTTFNGVPPDVDEFPEGDAPKVADPAVFAGDAKLGPPEEVKDTEPEPELPPTPADIEGEWCLTNDKNARMAAIALLDHGKTFNLHRVGKGPLPALIVRTIDPALRYEMLSKAVKVVVTKDINDPFGLDVKILYEVNKVYMGKMQYIGIITNTKATKAATPVKPAEAPAKPAPDTKEKPKGRRDSGGASGPMMRA